VSKIQEIRDNAGDIKLVNMIPNVYEIYELLEFENIIQAFDTLDQGKKSFNLPAGGESVGEKVWTTDEKIVSESGTTMQAAFSPGMKGAGSAADLISGKESRVATQLPKTSEEVIIRLVIDDPFSTISELVEQAAELAPKFEYGWWKVYGILRRNKLLRRRSRFRLSRKHTRRQSNFSW
jgi:hypothetical protein